LYMTLLASFEALLYRYTGQEDFLLGSPTTGRTRAEFAPLVGYFVNPVVVRADLSDPSTFIQHLMRVKQRVLDALRHQDYPLALLVERLRPSRDPSRSPLFDVTFAMQKAPSDGGDSLDSFALDAAGSGMALGTLAVESLALGQPVAQFDIAVMVAELGKEIGVSFQYNTDLFDGVTIARMMGHFDMLLKSIAADAKRNLSLLPMLTQAEVRQVMEEWQERDPTYRLDLCLHELIQLQADRSPD